MKEKYGYMIPGALIVFVSLTLTASELSKPRNVLEAIEQSPDAVRSAPGLVWRFIPHVGWRKFSPESAQYYDWKEWDKTTKPIWWRRR